MWVQCKEDKARSSSRRHRSLPAPLRNLLPLSVKQLSLLLPRAAVFCPALDALSKTSRGKRKETNSVGAPMICQMLPNMLPFNAHCIVPKALLLLYYVVESKTQRIAVHFPSSHVSLGQIRDSSYYGSVCMLFTRSQTATSFSFSGRVFLILIRIA